MQEMAPFYNIKLSKKVEVEIKNLETFSSVFKNPDEETTLGTHMYFR